MNLGSTEGSRDPPIVYDDTADGCAREAAGGGQRNADGAGYPQQRDRQAHTNRPISRYQRQRQYTTTTNQGTRPLA